MECVPGKETVNEKMYLAYCNKTKKLICYDYNKSDIELYLMRCGIYETSTIFDASDEQFQIAVRETFYELQLVKIRNGENRFLCTQDEYTYLYYLSNENRKRVRYVLDEFAHMINVLDLDEKEKKQIIKTGKMLSNKSHNIDEMIPKGVMDNKILRDMFESKKELYNIDETFADDFNLLCSKYYIVLI